MPKLTLAKLAELDSKARPPAESKPAAEGGAETGEVAIEDSAKDSASNEGASSAPSSAGADTTPVLVRGNFAPLHVVWQTEPRICTQHICIACPIKTSWQLNPATGALLWGATEPSQNLCRCRLLQRRRGASSWKLAQCSACQMASHQQDQRSCTR